MEKKDLAKLALKALILFSSLPTGSHAANEPEEQDLLLAAGSSAISGEDYSYGGGNEWNNAGAMNGYPANYNGSNNNFGYDSSYYTSPGSYDSHEYSYSYDYNLFGHPYQNSLSSRGFNSDAYLHERYDNSNNFSAGISSYQGTSTGPGPNGGYPGTPRGTYNTNYYPTESR
jgi:hypothetical protein